MGERARLKRADRFLAAFPDLASLDVLDLGGTRSFWDRLAVRPATVTAVNVLAENDVHRTGAEWFRPIVADACDCLADYGRRNFDLVFSNSTIEHVGDRNRRQQFADNVHQRADRHWIQTPNRAFPLEPHVLFPFEQFLPRRARALVARYWPLVHSNASSMESAFASADGTDLVARTEFIGLFPNSKIEGETVTRLLPAKSFVALRQ